MKVLDRNVDSYEAYMIKEFTYSGELLHSVCEYGYRCEYYMYHGDQLFKVEVRKELGDQSSTVEEAYYENGLLKERKLFASQAYVLSEVRNITNIVYHYVK